MKKPCLIYPIVLLLSLSMTITAFAHPGRLDSNGGHNKTADGTYHYHSGSDRSIEYSTPPSSTPVTPPQTQVQAPAQEISVMVEGSKVEFDQPPENISGRVMVPIRYVVEKMSCSVEWDGATQTVYINTADVPASKTAAKTDNINVYVNNEKIVFTDQQPINKNGRILIPVRFVTEKLGYEVEWNGDVQTVYINKIIASITPDGQKMTIHFIDVGQGDSIFIDFGDYECLIDAGTKGNGQKVVSYISPHVDGNLELLIATHPDADHVGGLVDVINAFQIDEIIDSGMTNTTKTYTDYYAAATSEPNCKFSYDEDRVIAITSAASIQIIETGDNYKDSNDNSVVALLAYGKVTTLLTGDMEAQSEKASLPKFQDINVLKAGHHGSKTSSGAEFLSIAKPEHVIVSAGTGNTYKHPHYEVLQRFLGIGATVYGTFKDGTIVMTTDGNTYSFNVKNTLTLDDAGDKAA